jgi:hypothetical protein
MPAVSFRICCGVFVALLGCVAFSGCNDAKSGGKPGAATASAAQQPLPTDAQLKAQLDDVIGLTLERKLSPQVNNAWQIVHGVLCYGDQLKLNDNGKTVPALEWILAGGKLKGWTMVPAEKGLGSLLEPGDKTGQGHEDQWLGYLSQSGVPLDAPLVVSGQTFKVRDLVTQAQWNVRNDMEATWTLMALSTYLPMDSKWKAKDGQEWTIEKIVALEAAQDLGVSACGGSHRMYGLTTAVNRYRNEGGKFTPGSGWQAAEDKIQATIRKAKEYQQADGSFSTTWFQRGSTNPDIALRISTTGHTLEFLSLALTDKQLAEPWMVRAVTFLCQQLQDTKDLPLECGGLYHAAHGLILYRQRRFGELALGGSLEPAAPAPSPSPKDIPLSDAAK